MLFVVIISFLQLIIYAYTDSLKEGLPIVGVMFITFSFLEVILISIDAFVG
ncbi:hypothetical protein 043JT007_21 [Bacillus phage 043JT007]|nr:hypothetical protein 043JT007_21 [Bacillus phage 043JT007]